MQRLILFATWTWKEKKEQVFLDYLIYVLSLILETIGESDLFQKHWNFFAYLKDINCTKSVHNKLKAKLRVVLLWYTSDI